MKAFVTPAIIGIAILGLPGVAGAQTREATGGVTVRVVRVLTSTTITSQLDFGHLKGDDKSPASGGMAGTVILTPFFPPFLPERTATGGATLLGVKTDGGGEFALAQFTVTGQADTPYSFSFIDPQFITSDGGTPLEVTLLPLSKNNGTNGKFDVNGFDEVLVGGVLKVPARTRPGKFIGAIVLDFNY